MLGCDMHLYKLCLSVTVMAEGGAYIFLLDRFGTRGCLQPKMQATKACLSA